MSRANIMSPLRTQFLIYYHTHRAIHLLFDQRVLFPSSPHQKPPPCPHSGFHICFHDCSYKEHLNMGGKAGRTTSSNTSSVSATVTIAKQKLLGGQSLQISSPGTEAGPGQATGAGHCSRMCVEQHKSNELCGTLIQIKIYPVVP